MDEIKSQEQSWISDSLSVIGCEKADSIKLLESIKKNSEGSFITSGKNSFALGFDENAIGMYKLPNSLVSGIQYAEVYSSVPVKSAVDVIKNLAIQSAIPSSLAVDNFIFNKTDYRLTINAPSRIPNYLAGTELFKNPILNLNSSEQNFINNLSTDALSTNYISLSKSDRQFASVDDLHSVHKFGLFPNGSLDLITDYHHINDANLFVSKSNLHIGSIDYGLISGNIISEKNTPNYFENILETRLNAYKSEMVNYINAKIHSQLSVITNHQIFYASNNFSLSEIHNIIDSKFEIFRENFIEDVRRLIGKELQKFKIELDKEGLFADSFDIIPGIGPVIKLGLKATKLISETKTIIM